MVQAIIAIIMALVSFFGSKKAGASDGQAAAIAAGAGFGTYYVLGNTEWGKGLVDNVSSWIGITDDGEPVLNADGSPATAPAGAEVVRNPDGTIARDEKGNVMWKLVSEAGDVLQSWGPAGTAGVIGAAGLLSTVKKNPWPWMLGAGALVLVIAN